MTLTHRYLTLLALRWFATGLIIPVAALLPLERGLTLAELGVAMAAQGVVVLLLEVPSGALTDAWGRRPVLLASVAAAATAYALVLVADSVATFALAWAVTGVFRALDSGPLEAWFVDAEHARGAAHEVPSGLARAGSVISAGIATGSLATAALLSVAPWSTSVTLAVPFGVAIVVVLVQGAAAAWLMDPAPPRGASTGAVWAEALRGGVATVARPGLRGLAVAMTIVAVGVVALETFMPVRLAELSGDRAQAAAQMGVVAAAAWGFASVGSAVVSRILRRRRPRGVAVALVAIEGVGLLAMSLATGPALLVAGFWLGYLVHTGFGSTYNSLVHERVDDAHRGTALSITSMAFLGSASAAGVLLGVLAEHTSSSTSLLVGAGAMAVAGATIAAATRR
ncbi:MFS transporter [Aeromicrobium sp.]|uniref:MFS transporter n=1 Tax=Aeromicrobium sp. TaxID=1871063 RepID=UPI0025BE108D|nr:MFS transporter [Aeromicrobium sp.]MCK5890230.1 MFS transporter [Aeromicrobium sp.]